jgi:hypothetical protein
MMDPNSSYPGQGGGYPGQGGGHPGQGGGNPAQGAGYPGLGAGHSDPGSGSFPAFGTGTEPPTAPFPGADPPYGPPTAPFPSPEFPSPEPPPSDRRRVRTAFLLGALLVLLLLGGYAYATRGDSPQAALSGPPGAAGSSVVPSSTPGISAAPSASSSPSATPSSAKPSAKATQRSSGGRPGPANTGVPKGTRLSDYHGPCTITKAGTTIDAKKIGCDVVVRAANVTIKRSKINGVVLLDSDVPGSSRWSYTLADSEVDAGVQEHPAVSYGNMTVLRSNIHGGITSVQCGEKAIGCTVEDSWLHGQQIKQGTDWHLGGFLSNGGHNIRIRHNNIVCDTPATPDGQGCTGDLNLLGDFAVISDVVISDNFLGANTGSSFCFYGGDAASKPYPHANKVVVTDNVFERGTNGKCADYGPVSSFNVDGPGNVWKNNTWSDGGKVTPEL